MSVVVTQIVEALHNPRTSAAQIAALLKRDQVLTAKVLRLVNSGFYGRPVEITDIARALSFIGDNTLSALIVGTSVFTPADLTAASYFDVREFWKHSLASAVAAELIALEIRRARPEECFTCAPPARHREDRAFPSRPRKLKTGRGTRFASRGNFSAGRAGAGTSPATRSWGEKLAESWKLPLVVRKTIRYHHRDVLGMESLFPAHREVVMITVLGDVMAKRLSLGFSGDEVVPDYPAGYLAALGLARAALPKIEEILVTEMKKAEALLNAKPLPRVA